MRINEYKSIDEFKEEFTGIWSPSDGHWFGLDFIYQNTVYRLNTGSMYAEADTTLLDGRNALFYIYQLADKPNADYTDYQLIGKYADINELLECCLIGGRKFKDVIMDDTTEILGKD